jgi:hypothetical protein
MTKQTTWLLLAQLLVGAVPTLAQGGEPPAIRMPEKPPQPSAPGLRVARLEVERNGRRLPLASWSPCATDVGDVRFIATLESASDASFDQLIVDRREVVRVKRCDARLRNH